ncbi:2'-5' RNA ligase superfamily protein [Paenibacillus sp. VMFN-D1]|nr:2'-5' RNA ligase superfamily protein [Paenibacillus sp. VMFN-D1]
MIKLYPNMLRKYKINDHILRWGYDSGINIEQFISDFDRFYESQKQISITLSSLGTFLNPGALFLAPVPSKEFLEIHGNHHNYFEIYRASAETQYLPNNWIPHCTLANRLNDEKLKEATVYCTNRIEPLTTSIVEISVIKAIYENNKCIKSPLIHTKVLKRNVQKRKYNRTSLRCDILMILEQLAGGLLLHPLFN